MGARFRVVIAPMLMLLTVMAVYFPIPRSAGDNTLGGVDFERLHSRRMAFAREALFSDHPHLPAWYPREAMGTPFWSNIQSFPFLPTRLVLLWVDPLKAYAVGIEMAACLAAGFTYLYARRLGLVPIAAALAGFTFACSGFFASRIPVGHLPLLEVCFALPMLLWLIETCFNRQRDAEPLGGWLVALGLASAMIFLAGHPQIPIYAFGAALLYVICRFPTRKALPVAGAMLIGPICDAFVLYPAMLLTRLSTRVLPLPRAGNDICFPYRRLLSLALPWIDGWPSAIDRGQGAMPFYHANGAYFWDTVGYVGWLPLLAAAALLVRAVIRRQRPSPAWAFLAVMGPLSLALAFPFFARLVERVPGTYLRSSARLLYLTTFALAMALGAAAQALMSHRWRWNVGPLAVAIVVIVQVFDLGAFDRHFVWMSHVDPPPDQETVERARRDVGDARVAADVDWVSPLNREVDDVGFYDSLILARPYRALFEAAGVSPLPNVQSLDGSDLNQRALAFAGVRFLFTDKQINAGSFQNMSPARRAEFFPADRIVATDQAKVHKNLSDPAFDLAAVLLVEGRIDFPLPAKPRPIPAAAEVHYERPSSDEIDVSMRCASPGVLRILEAYHPGWTVTVDGAPAPVVLADDAFLAVPLVAGAHVVTWRFTTPGAGIGKWISLCGLVALGLLAFLQIKRNARSIPQPPVERGNATSDFSPLKRREISAQPRPRKVDRKRPR